MRVLVVGAGVIGCAIGYELAARGVDVVILDPRRPGDGATQAAAGMLVPFIEGHSASLLQLGEASLSLYDGFVERVRAASGHAVEYQRAGSLEVALTDEDVGRLRATTDRYQRAGVEHQWLDPHEALALEPALAPSTRAAVLVPSHGAVSARGLAAALAGAAERLGAKIVSRAAKRVTASGAGLLVTDNTDGHFMADAVVLAAGCWSGQVSIERAPQATIRPIRGQLLQLAGVRAMAGRVLWGPDCYLVPWRDGTMLVGATVEDAGFDEHATVAGVRDLLDGACQLVPSAASARFEAVRVGLRPATSDEIPIIGRAAGVPNVVYATGHYRNGMLLAPLTAAVVADLLIDQRERPELALTRPSRFGL